MWLCIETERTLKRRLNACIKKLEIEEQLGNELFHVVGHDILTAVTPLFGTHR